MNGNNVGTVIVGLIVVACVVALAWLGFRTAKIEHARYQERIQRRETSIVWDREVQVPGPYDTEYRFQVFKDTTNGVTCYRLFEGQISCAATRP